MRYLIYNGDVRGSVVRCALLDSGMPEHSRNCLYAVQIEPPTGPIKIGRSAHGALGRWTEIIGNWPKLYPLKTLFVLNEYARWEHSIHTSLESKRLSGEWFNADCIPPLFDIINRIADSRQSGA